MDLALALACAAAPLVGYAAARAACLALRRRAEWHEANPDR